MDLTLELLIKRARDDERERCLRLVERRIRMLEVNLSYWKERQDWHMCVLYERQLLELRTVRDWIATPGMTETDTAALDPGGIPREEG